MKKNASTSQMKKQSAFPVLKLDYNFNVIYSNDHATPILKHWEVEKENSVPPTVLNNHPEIYNSLRNPAVQDININIEGALIRCSVVPFPEAGYIGVYGYMVEYAERIKECVPVQRMN